MNIKHFQNCLWEITEDVSGFDQKQLISKSKRCLHLCWARHCAMAAARECGLTHTEVGALFKRDHSACVHSYQVFKHNAAPSLIAEGWKDEILNRLKNAVLQANKTRKTKSK